MREKDDPPCSGDQKHTRFNAHYLGAVRVLFVFRHVDKSNQLVDYVNLPLILQVIYRLVFKLIGTVGSFTKLLAIPGCFIASSAIY